MARVDDLAGALDASEGQRAALDRGVAAVHLQLRAERDPTGDVAAIARRGIAGGGGPLPFRDRIQAAFGRHDVSGVRAHTGAEAARASASLGALGFTMGDAVAFGGSPSLFTAAHEAAHAVQQRAGVRLRDGVGRRGDAYERHADEVASAVCRGASAEALLDRFAGGRGGAGGGGPVQLREEPGSAPLAPSDPAIVGTQSAETAATTAPAPDGATTTTQATPPAPATSAPSTATPAEPATTGDTQAAAPEPAPQTPEAAEVARLVAEGQSLNTITDAVFYLRHPELAPDQGAATPELQAEWLDIQGNVVKPAILQAQLAALQPAGASQGAPGTGAAMIYDPVSGTWKQPDMGGDLAAQVDSVWAAHEPTYHNGSEFGTAGCHRATSASLEEMGWVPGDITFQEVGDDGLSAEEKQLAIAILESELAAGRPVEIGVNYRDGDPGNRDNATDHWLYVAAMSTDSQGARVYLAIDNAKVETSAITTGGLVPFTVRPDGTCWHDPYYPTSSNEFSNQGHTICQVRKCTPKPGVPAPPELAEQAAAPAPEAPTSEAPTSEAPTSEAPTSEAPTSEAPTSEAPTSDIAPAPAPMPDEKERVKSAYQAGQHGVEQLTNMVFYARHPERVVDGQTLPITTDEPTLAAEWKDIRATIVQPAIAELTAVPAPAAPATSADEAGAPTSEPTTEVAPAAPAEPGVGQQIVGAAKDLYDAAWSWTSWALGIEDEPAPPPPEAAAPAPAPAPADEPAAAAPAAQSSTAIDPNLAAAEQLADSLSIPHAYDHDSAAQGETVINDPLVTQKRVAALCAGDAEKLQTILCSEFTTLSLARAGYDLDQRYLVPTEPRLPIGYPEKNGSFTFVKLYMLTLTMREPTAAIVDHQDGKAERVTAGSERAKELNCAGEAGDFYYVPMGDINGHTLDADHEFGAGVAAVALGGKEVELVDRKPGDLQQTFEVSGGTTNGKGHSSTVYTVLGHGVACLGQAGSPKVVDSGGKPHAAGDGKSGWFEITADSGLMWLVEPSTDPTLVASLTCVSFTLIEANIEKGRGGSSDATGVSGVQASGASQVTSNGRLPDSKWINWSATAPQVVGSLRK